MWSEFNFHKACVQISMGENDNFPPSITFANHRHLQLSFINYTGAFSFKRRMIDYLFMINNLDDCYKHFMQQPPL